MMSFIVVNENAATGIVILKISYKPFQFKSATESTINEHIMYYGSQFGF